MIFENLATQEINVEKELPKTLEEYVIKEIESYKKMNADLAEELRIAQNINFKQNEEIEDLKNKYEELVERLKEDLEPQISTTKIGDVLIEFKCWSHFKKYSKLQYEYYKNLFNLKEECEENVPEKETIKS